MKQTKKNRSKSRFQKGGFFDWLKNTYEKTKDGTSGFFSNASNSISSGFQNVTNTLNKDVSLTPSNNSSSSNTTTTQPTQSQPTQSQPTQNTYVGGKRKSKRSKSSKSKKSKKYRKTKRRKLLKGGGYAKVYDLKVAKPTYWVK